MAASIVSSIIFFLLFIILSLFVDGNVFAAQMEHRKLGGAKETMTTRRNLEENSSNKIGATPSRTQHAGQKNTDKEPSQTHPDQARPRLLNYKTLRKQEPFTGRPQVKCDRYHRCKRGSLN